MLANQPHSMVRRLGGVDIGVRRISSRVESPHTIAIPRVASKSGVVEGSDIGTDLSNLHKVCAAIALTTLDLETRLVV